MIKEIKKLSICIPTYNRSYHLNNCLNSIIQNGKICKDIDICISDNNSSDNTIEIIKPYKKILNIKYKKNSANIGVAKNILSSVEISNSEFCWIIGDDDLLLDNALEVVLKLIKIHKNKDFFYINSFHLRSSVLKNYNHPIKTTNLPKTLKKFSNYNEDIDGKFKKLINTNICFDFFGGSYLSVFRKKNWDINLDKIDYQKLDNKLLFSNLDNTFPHTKIFSYAFIESDSYFYSRPLTINLHGEREWKDLYPIVRTFRTSELLESYYNNGIDLITYIKNKNSNLRYFIPDIIKIVCNLKNTYYYIPNLFVFFLKNFYYPNIYLSIFYQISKTLKKFLNEKKM